MKNKTACFPLALLLALAAAPAGAERADRNKPMNIEADSLRYDDLQQTSIFTGKVVVTKGTIVIRGAKMVVKQDPEGFQSGTVTAEPGQQAYFKQKRDGVDEYIEGEAETIQYDGKADRVKFIGRAEMRRLRGAAVNDETSGSVITYDNTNDQFTVEGGASAGGTPSNPGGRVRATLAPRPAASGAAGAGAGGRASATLPAPQSPASARLRPSTGLPPETR
ncbi:lipopolysaccharide transport periplasmic protein LptA [Ramlibacter alkalitolerans]|uniref:Lipopolysaccharide export system protein LptA n=1 Tax=Ramlibacter alkalitolerans TaxID=2039631 RepID=A0ABS1JSH1_9BURK|nr:lipopolysaccharide transport periplasmic protein LptA [Ramlibacter alkalitolerans]MBL0427205.1 lipopolysaccharide transport periplasmic protein LptA [Ramlibacter alkalitolerans]